MRRKLGESLASIQKYDTPLEQATTYSLEEQGNLVVAGPGSADIGAFTVRPFIG